MGIVLVDGREVEVGDQERINGIQAAERAGVEIPHYCWHAGLTVVASCRMCLVVSGTRNPDTGAIAMGAEAGACLPDARQGRHGFRHQQRECAQGPGDGRRGLADRSSDRLPDLRQGGRMPLAGLPLRAWPERAPAPTSARSPAAARHGGHRHAVRRPLRDVHALRALHARNQRH